MDDILEGKRRIWFYSGICPHTGIVIPAAAVPQIQGLDWIPREVLGVFGDVGSTFNRNPKLNNSDCHPKSAR